VIFYVTFNDLPSGIYFSQVTDVVAFIRHQLQKEIRLVAFISLRNFSQNKKAIKKELGDAIVVPMVPGVTRWRLNKWLLSFLCFIYKPEVIVGRSVLASMLAFYSKCRARIVYDGRGAISAEWKEYGVITDTQMLSEIAELEKHAVLEAWKRIAVSEHLVNYWKREFNYDQGSHVIIPCTLNKQYESLEVTNETILQSRKRLGFDTTDIVFVYAGSISGWQGFDLLYNFMRPILNTAHNYKLLLLCAPDKNTERLLSEFQGQVKRILVSPSDVPAYLLAGDYGLLIREASVTNEVASPVKFAEYLACGLKVVISPYLGDYSNFVAETNTGIVSQGQPAGTFTSVSINEKLRCRNLSLKTFTKSVYEEKYREIFA
jgi:hypothetical protein